MERALVINEIGIQYNPSGCKYGCNPFKKPDAFVVTSQLKQKTENETTVKLNSLMNEGYEFCDGEVFSHKLFIANEYTRKGLHGVYRYAYNGKDSRYKVYFGPLILVDLKRGCKLGKFGCKPGKLGCKPGKLSCKKRGCKNLGCKKTETNKQYLNFRDNDLNQEIVQKLNDHFGIIRNETLKDGYKYESLSYEVEFETVMSELVKEHYDELLAQYTQDVQQIYSEGYGFEKLIDTPSEINLYTQAMLFSSNSQKHVTLAELKDFGAQLKHTTYLNKFDLWYFPVAMGLLRKLWTNLLKAIGIYKEKVIDGTPIITNENIERLEEVYTNDFNSQRETKGEYKQTVETVKELVSKLCKIPVTIAIKRKQGWFSRLFLHREYDYHTFLVTGIEEK